MASGLQNIFLNLEKRRSKERTLNTLISEDGTEVSDMGDILKIGKEFYENLYSSQEDSLDPMERIEAALSGLDMPTLSEDHKN